MNQQIAQDGAVRYQRITRRAARKAYDANIGVVFCPVKLYPFGGFRPSCLVSKADMQERTFDQIDSDFINYNCAWNETGYYPSYWIAVVPLDRITRRMRCIRTLTRSLTMQNAAFARRLS